MAKKQIIALLKEARQMCDRSSLKTIDERVACNVGVGFVEIRLQWAELAGRKKKRR